MKILNIIIILFCSIIAKSQEPILEEYVNFAIENNPGISASYLSYESSMQKVPQAKSMPDPTIAFGYFISPVETRTGAQQFKISANQMIPAFGTLKASEQEAYFEAQADFQKYNTEKNKLAFDVKKLWYQLYLLKKSIEFSQKQSDILSGLVRQATSNFETGQSGMSDVLLLEMKKDELDNKILIMNENIVALENEFNLLINKKQGSPVEISDTLIYHQIMPGITDSISKNSSSCKMFDSKITANEYRIKKSKLNSYPKIGIGLDYVFVGERTDMVTENSGKDIIMPMVSVSIPIYRKKYKSSILENELKEKQIISAKENQLNILMIEYQRTMQKYRSSEHDLALYSELLRKAETAFGIVKTSYSTGAKNFYNVSELQNMILMYKLKSIEALTSLLTNEAYLQFLAL